MIENVKRKARWLIQNAVIWVSGALWMVYGNEYAGNLNVFLIWAYFLSSFVVFSDKVAKAMKKAGPAVPYRVDMSVDLVYTLCLATAGHLFLGGIFVLGSIIHRGGFDRALPENYEEK